MAPRTVLFRLAVVGWLFAVPGCARETYPVEGTVVVSGDLSALAGSVVEAVAEGEPHKRASGEIQPDGRFVLETLQDGRIHPGAPKGTYRVRIIPSDDSRQIRRKALAAIPARYLKLQTSPLTLTVPATGEIVLKAQ